MLPLAAIIFRILPGTAAHVFLIYSTVRSFPILVVVLLPSILDNPVWQMRAREEVGRAGVCGAGHEDEARGLGHVGLGTLRRPLPLDLPAQLAHLGGADGGVRRRGGNAGSVHGTPNSRCGGASPASRSKSSLHEGVGGQRLGYLHISYICKHMHSMEMCGKYELLD